MDQLEKENRIFHAVIGSAIHVHNVLGPGLLEKVYEECLCHMIVQKGYSVERQKVLPIAFEDIVLDAGLRLDLLVDDSVVLEIKSVDKIIPVHEAQLYTYLKLLGKRLGLLMNFNEKLMKDGIKRMVMT
jgi:GxxExxY protein